MSNKARGNARELRARDVLVADGWFVIKGGGSLGAADLVALKAGHLPRLIQVKGSKAGPFSDFGPGERARLIRVAYQAGAVAELWWWPPTPPGARAIDTLRIMPPTQWPEMREQARVRVRV